MKKTKILALILVVCTLLTIPSFAADTRASEQIHMHLVYAVAEPGQIYVEASIYGNGIMDKIGCQNLQILKMTDSGWELYVSLFEDDEGMSSEDTYGHIYAETFESEVGVEYYVLVTVFAENENGRDTRTYEYYVTGI